MGEPRCSTKRKLVWIHRCPSAFITGSQLNCYFSGEGEFGSIGHQTRCIRILRDQLPLTLLPSPEGEG